jgi:hypothetical protein
MNHLRKRKQNWATEATLQQKIGSQLIESKKKSNLKKVRSRRDPLWNKVPSYRVEALISSINEPQELILALQSEYRERNALKGNRVLKGKQDT